MTVHVKVSASISLILFQLRSVRSKNICHFSSTDGQEFASTILWLEDQKIRFYTIDDRVGLRDIQNTERWNQAYEKYKTDIGCPQLSTRTEDMSWFLGYAVRLEYMDRADVYKSVSAAQMTATAQKTAEPITSSKNPFDSMDMRSDDFERNVRKLGKLLNIAHHPDHLKVGICSSFSMAYVASLVVLLLKLKFVENL